MANFSLLFCAQVLLSASYFMQIMELLLPLVINCTNTGFTDKQTNILKQLFTAQCFLNYVLLCLVFTTTLACRPGEGGLLSVLRKRGLKYFFLAIADVEANYLVVHAYQYTTLRSAQLLDCFAIPAVLVLSRTVLKVRYQIIHVIGVKVCLVGIFCLVWAIPDENNETAKDRLIGKDIKLLFICIK